MWSRRVGDRGPPSATTIDGRPFAATTGTTERRQPTRIFAKADGSPTKVLVCCPLPRRLSRRPSDSHLKQHALLTDNTPQRGTIELYASGRSRGYGYLERLPFAVRHGTDAQLHAWLLQCHDLQDSLAPRLAIRDGGQRVGHARAHQRSRRELELPGARHDALLATCADHDLAWPRKSGSTRELVLPDQHRLRFANLVAHALTTSWRRRPSGIPAHPSRSARSHPTASRGPRPCT